MIGVLTAVFSAETKIEEITLDGAAASFHRSFACGADYRIVVAHPQLKNGVLVNADLVFACNPDTAFIPQWMQVTGCCLPEQVCEALWGCYQAQGESVFSRLAGPFTIMVYDPKQHRGRLYRDRLGQAPLYAVQNETALGLCTLMKPLIKHKALTLSINLSYLATHLAVRSAAMPMEPEVTVFNQMRLLAPSGVLVIADYRLYPQSRPKHQEKQTGISPSDQHLRQILTQAIEETTVSKQVGIMLSGGLDSTMVAALAAQGTGKPILAYTQVPIAVPSLKAGLMADESPLVDTLVQHFPRLQSLKVRAPGLDALTVIDEVLEYMEMPYKVFENSHWTTDLFHRAKAEGIEVLLHAAFGNATLSFGDSISLMISDLLHNRWVSFVRHLNEHHLALGTSRLKTINRVLRQLRQGTSVDLDYVSYVRYPVYPFRNYDRFPSFEQRLALMRGSHAVTMAAAINAKVSAWYGFDFVDVTSDARVIELMNAASAEQYVRKGIDRAYVRVGALDLLPASILKNRRYGVQGADYAFRLINKWEDVRQGVRAALNHPILQALLDCDRVEALIESIPVVDPESPKEEGIRFLMRLLIVHRYLLKWEVWRNEH